MGADLTIRGLRLTLGSHRNRREILKGIDLTVTSGRITGLAGESGSGKTLTGLSILRLEPAGAVLDGEILFAGDNLVTASPRSMNRVRGKQIAMVFQDPTSALHPMIRIDTQLTDHYRIHARASKDDAVARAAEMLERVQIPDPTGALKKYPHQFSGGQLQRIAIACALMCSPQVLIADEPTTALDVTVQAGVLRLLRELCDDLGVGVLLVTHDLGVMSALADRIIVLRNGEVVEEGGREQVMTRPTSDYTRGLIDALPAAQITRETNAAVMTSKDRR